MVEWFDVVSNKTIDQLVCLANSVCLPVLDIEFGIPMGPLSQIICNTEIYWQTHSFYIFYGFSMRSTKSEAQREVSGLLHVIYLQCS